MEWNFNLEIFILINAKSTQQNYFLIFPVSSSMANKKILKKIGVTGTVFN